MQKKTSKFELNFLKKEKQSKDAYSFYFDRKGIDFDFAPGQYLKLFLDIENPDDRGSSRYFTISSSPTDKDYLTITTRIIQSSFKLKLDSLKSGDKVRAFGPIGYFDFDPKFVGHSIFIAGGIGITPFHSILRFLDSKKLNSKITLFVSFPNKEETIFFDEFKGIEKRDPSIKIIYSLTKEEDSSPEFEKGRISVDMIRKYVQEYFESRFFITGPEAMVLSVFDMIKDSGISEENIFKEDFPGY